VVERTVHSVMPPRTSYALTAAGRGLQNVIDAIDQWGKQHLQSAMEAKRQSAAAGA
jgi:DNA-binding HxlR family transcriptional regulator